MNELGALLVRLLFDDSDFTGGLDSAQKDLEKSAKGFDQLGKTISSAFTATIVASTAAVAGFTAATVAIGARFDKEIATVGAVARASAGELEQLRDTARDLGATTTFSATEAASALQNFARAGLSVGDSIAASGPALALAQAAAADLGLATASTVATLAQFRLGASESARVADVLAAATTQTQFGLEGLTDALKNAGPAGASVGLSLEETVAAVSQFRNLGLDASTSGVIFRNVLTDLVKPTREAEETIKALGLELEDLDPTKVPFDQLLVRLRDAGAGTAAFATIFGKFGLQVQGVAETVDDAKNGVQALAASFREGGQASAVAEQATANVFDQFRILASGTEELFLSVFDSIRAPLSQVLDSLIVLVGQVSQAFNDIGGTIEGSVQGGADAISAFLKENGQAIAQTFAVAARAVADFARNIASLASLFGPIIPLLDDLAKALIVAFGVSKILAFATAITKVVVGVRSYIAAQQAARFATIATGTATAGAAAATTAFATATKGAGVALAGATGGLSAVLTVLSTVVVLFADYVINADSATASTEALIQSQQDLRDALATTAAVQEDQIGKVLEAQQAAAREQLRSADSLDNATRSQLESVLSLTAAEARRGILAGQLVVLDGQVLDLQQAISEQGNEGVERLTAIAAGTRQFGAELGLASERLGTLVGDFENGFDVTKQTTAAVRDLRDGIKDGSEAAAILDKALSDGNVTQADAVALRDQLSELSKREIASSNALLNNTEKARRALIEEATAAREVADATSSQADSAKDAADEIERALSAIQKILQAEQAEAISFLPKPEQIRIETAQLLAELDAARSQVLASQAISEAERTAALQDAAAARLAVLGNANQQLSTLAEETNRKITDSAAQRSGILLSFLEEEVSQAEQIRREAQATALQLEKQFATEQAAIRARAQEQLPVDATEGQRVAATRRADEEIEALDRDLAAARVQISAAAADRIAAIEAERQAAAEQAAAELVASTERFNRQILNSFVSLPGPIERSFAGAFRSIRDDAIQKFPQISRLILDIKSVAESTASAIVGAFSEASRQIQSVFSAFSGTDFLDVSGFAEAGGEALSSAINDLADLEADAAQRISDLRSELQGTSDLDERKDILSQIADEERQLAEDRLAAEQAIADAREGSGAAAAVNEAADRAIQFAEALPASISAALDTLATRLPEIVSGIAESIPEAAQAIADNIGPVVQALVDALPQIIDGLSAALQTLIAALPDIISSLLGALPEIISSLLGAIPEIISALLAALPEILASIFDAIPRIIAAIIAAIPDILASLIAAVPSIISSLIEALPVLLESVIQSLPAVFSALVSAIPTILIAFIGELPRLITGVVALVPDLITGVIENLPDLIEGLVTTLVTEAPQLAVAIGKAIVLAVKSIIDSLVSIFSDIFKRAFNGLKRRAEETSKELDKGRTGERTQVGAALAATASFLGFQGGESFVQRTAGAILHPGEAVLTAAENRERLFGVNANNRTAPIGRSNLASNQAGQMGPISVQVNVAGRDLDRVLLESDAAGQMGLTQKSNRRKTGTRAGFVGRKAP